MPLSKIVANSITDNTITTDQIADTSVHGRRNLIINGAMQVSQRGTSFATMGNGDSQYTLDRFKWQESGSPTLEMTVTQDSSSPNEMGNSKSLKVEVTTAQSSLGSGDRVRIEQYIEAQNCQSIAKGTSAAKALSASFWVKSSKTGTYIVELQENDNDRINSQSYSISSANTWEHKTLTFPADTTGAINNDTGNGISFRMYLCAGTDYTSGSLNTSWVGVSGNNTGAAVGQVNLADTVNATWYITGVQLEVGDKATPFEHRSPGEELALCQRYYVEYRNSRFINGYKRQDAQTAWKVKFPVPMRATPAVTLDDGGSFTNFQSVYTATQSSPVIYEPGAELSEIVLTVNSTYSGTHEVIPSWESQEVIFDAEL